MSTYLTDINNIIGAITGLAAIGCVAIVLVAIFKIVIGDEQDQQKYIKRIKNALLALVLILTCVNIGNAVLSYFGTKNSDGSYTTTFSIGSIENTDVKQGDINEGINQTAKDAYEEVKDKIDWENEGDSGIYLINGSWYYCSKYYDKKNIGSITNSFYVKDARLLRSVTDDSKSYIVISGGYRDGRMGSYSDITDVDGNTGKFIIEYPSFGNRINDESEFGDAIFARADLTTENKGTDDEFEYYKATEVSVDIGNDE